MTLQEHYDKSEKIIFHGCENDYCLIAFEDGGEVFRFTNKEVKEFSKQFKSPEDLEHDARMEETSRKIDAEMRRRLDQANVNVWFYAILAVLMLPLSYWTVSQGKPYGMIYFGLIMLFAIWRFCRNRNERKVIMKYFKIRKDWYWYN